jgi:predicted RNA-binding Zn-ribbon protein involved in translation (DUF1610 family)
MSDIDTPHCPYCGSEESKRNVLGLPRFFDLAPALYGTLILIGAVVTIMHGVANSNAQHPSGAADSVIEILAGTAVAALAIVAMANKSHKCTACEQRFNWPPFFTRVRVRCPQCGVELKGADAGMIGDTGVCPKCGHEFVIGRK